MSRNYKSVCEELDALTVSYLSILEEYREQWKEISSELQEGFLELAHAKYTMGTKVISHYSYDTRMKAILEVEIDDLNRINVKKDEKMKRKEGLRQRKMNKEEEKEEKKVERKRDPIYWFGLFVSPSLYKSQDKFKKSIESLIEQVNKMKRLEEIEKRYKELIKEKEMKN
ncbi:hypothetical protein G6F57_000687 [Rhizopus arrhizus]|uniref:Vacuolar ATPase assembly protein VMA22 n=1 Tax=Rhizopus oryzae TaxID=64495 RepID=A0A9P7BUK1_RHIOR|nr:hypothetical protein G6F24_003942 [Rhizopus arrhizus]KAG1423434.1 hypothetical protein G6F58_002813 [Rhizopus delemar]KAG0797861.1 hypothetical protein G6F21_000172 [Rhizopus arrhizus]KAG0819526.1 hypothetical protein G6F20_000696 [Rhizopus arrhizus]KAG0844092.1 hypothetical protein G6F19_000069 [Rhizopus arrhizus]